MSDLAFILDVLGPRRPSRWAVVAFLVSCSFTAGAMTLLLLTLAI
jgi:hypothetical protein